MFGQRDRSSNMEAVSPVSLVEMVDVNQFHVLTLVYLSDYICLTYKSYDL